MADRYYQLEADEKEIFNEVGLWSKAKLNAQPGRLTLTNKRILFVKNSNPFAGLLIRLLFKKQGSHVTHDISLKNLKNYEQVTYGINKNVLSLDLNDGTNVKFIPGRPCAEWVAKLDELKK
jgi:hypothetical protein